MVTEIIFWAVNMPRKTMKKRFQRRQFRRGERRLRGDEVKHYLILANSEDPRDRIEAMENLCPCHVRKRIEVVWEALYRGLQDRNLNVRQAAWHTLEENHGAFSNGNKAAGTRARKAAGEFKKIVTDYRKASVSESK